MPEQGLKMELHGNKLLILKKIKKFSTWVLTVLRGCIRIVLAQKDNEC